MLCWHSNKHTLWPAVTVMLAAVLEIIAITCHQECRAALKAGYELQEVTSCLKSTTRPVWAKNQVWVHILLSPMLVSKWPPVVWGISLSRGLEFDFQCSCAYVAALAGWPTNQRGPGKRIPCFGCLDVHILRYSKKNTIKTPAHNLTYCWFI